MYIYVCMICVYIYMYVYIPYLPSWWFHDVRFSTIDIGRSAMAKMLWGKETTNERSPVCMHTCLICTCANRVTYSIS